ncbi:MAG: carboxylesterase [Gallionella sp.]|nr:carboxylesterase [Gallionella sp.]
MSPILQNITLESAKDPRYSIIWLHGLGADGHDFVPVVDELRLSAPVRYIFPHAPQRPVTINDGFVMRAWYDIAAADIDARQDETGIRAAQREVEKLIAREAGLGIAPDHIFLAGFSQGGAIALQTALRQSAPLAGVLALSTYLPLAPDLHAEMQHATRNTPIFMAHGRGDTVVPYTLGMRSKDLLLESGYSVNWHDYPMAHSVCDKELHDIEVWLNEKMDT